MSDPKPNRAVRLSATCHERLDALAGVVGRPKGQIVETLAAGGIRAYVEGLTAQASAPREEKDRAAGHEGAAR